MTIRPKIQKKSKHRLALENKYRKAGYSNKDAEEKANRAIKIEKAIAIAGGVTVAAATAYVASKEIRRRIDGKIKWGYPHSKHIVVFR